MIITIIADPIPQPRQRQRVIQRNGVAIAANYMPAKHPIAGFKETCRASVAMQHNGPPLSGPLSVGFEFVFARPKRITWKTKPMLSVDLVTKPDCDNLMKAVMDSLNGVLWRDDCQICRWSGRKRIASGYEEPRVVLTVEELSARPVVD